jgi:signal transduction histidine kinase
MGGNIEVESTLGRGTLFKVSLPLYVKEEKGDTAL